ncbi:hypothetical protein D915_009926 [Fasciola hepatica]|uniref:Chloride channel CLIC-like protein 1 n=1 Tax=Fasciola hepatica TaxID=6192 RepID=A0A4E0RBC7_FASHE|nr:hypothetical protein D915_009926 [Fasciola hepatica]
MFSDVSSNEDYGVATQPSARLLPAPQSTQAAETISTLKHYRELHLVLARILWRSLQVAENHSLTEGDHVRIQLIASLSPSDIRMLSTYCHRNQSTNKQVSADSINSLFSRLFESAVLLSDDPPDRQSPQLQYLFGGLVLFIFFLIARLIGVKRILLISLPSLFITAVILQALYRKYNERVAEKMSHMSRYNEPPEQCKPSHLQSWSTWLSGLVRFSPSHDECAQYYERVLTDPWIATSLYEIFLELVFEPLVTLSKLSGRACGQLYHQLNMYFPTLVALPLTVVMFLFLLFLVLCFIRSSSSARRPSNPKRRHKPQCIKQKHVPSLCESKKQ